MIFLIKGFTYKNNSQWDSLHNDSSFFYIPPIATELCYKIHVAAALQSAFFQRILFSLLKIIPVETLGTFYAMYCLVQKIIELNDKAHKKNNMLVTVSLPCFLNTQLTHH